MSSPSRADLHVGLLTSDLTHRHGWGHYSLSLIQALQRAGVRLTVIAARNSPPLDGVTLLPILPMIDPMPRRMLVQQLRALPETRVALRDCDLIHSTIEPYAPLAALAAGSRPLIITGHGSYVVTAQRRRFPVGALYGWAYRRGLMVCVSHYTAHAAESATPGIKTAVVNNGVDYERFGAVEHVGGGGVLTVGAVKARKGVIELVRALAQLPDARCTIVGSLTMEPAYADRVRAEIARLNVGDRITLTGRVADADLLAYYAQADLFVMASLNVGWKFEGFGLTLLEASAAGLPVIGTRDCGAEDAVIEGETGLLVGQSDLEHDLAAAIRDLLADSARAAQLGVAGRDYARAQTWDRVAAQMIGLYKSRVS